MNKMLLVTGTPSSGKSTHAVNSVPDKANLLIITAVGTPEVEGATYMQVTTVEEFAKVAIPKGTTHIIVEGITNMCLNSLAVRANGNSKTNGRPEQSDYLAVAMAMFNGLRGLWGKYPLVVVQELDGSKGELEPTLFPYAFNYILPLAHEVNWCYTKNSTDTKSGIAKTVTEYLVQTNKRLAVQYKKG